MSSFSSLESPSKRRKTDRATSTPLPDSHGQKNVLPSVSESFAMVSERRASSSASTSSSSAISLQKLQDKSTDVRQRAYISTTSDDLDTDSELDQSTAAQQLDYDAFFENLGSFRRTGKPWQWFKPTRNDPHLYTQILNNLTKTEELAEKFRDYCSENPDKGLFMLIRLVVDCAGYQTLDIAKIDVLNDFVKLAKKLCDYKCGGQVFESLKFLFKENDKLSTIIKMGIFRFIQKFILLAFESKFLFGPQFTLFMDLPALLCETNLYHLIYTGVYFNMKILTAICMVKSYIHSRDIKVSGIATKLLSTHINTTFVKVVKICTSNYANIHDLKVAFIKEMELWIDFSPQIFIDHYECWKVLINNHVVDCIDKSHSVSVRLAALNLVKKIVLNMDCQRFLKKGPIEIIAKKVAERFEDVNENVIVKALEVYNSMCVHYFSVVQDQQKIYHSLIQLMADPNYDIAKTAGKCVVDMIKAEGTNEMELLISIATIVENHHGGKPHLVVEALIENPSQICQNWALYMEFFTREGVADLPQIVTALSVIFLEAVQQVLTGKSPRMRQKPIEDDVPRDPSITLLDQFLPSLKNSLLNNKENPLFLTNLLKVAMEIDLKVFSEEHVQPLKSLIAKLMRKLFVYHDDSDFLKALIDFLVHISKFEPLQRDYERVITQLQKDTVDEFLESIRKEDTKMILHYVKKLTMLFSRFDMSEYSMGEDLLESWTKLDDAPELRDEYVYCIMQCCRHRLIFELNKLGSSFLPRSMVNQQVQDLLEQRQQFLGKCFDTMGKTKDEMRRNVWAEIAEMHLDWGKQLEKISKDKYWLQNSLPVLTSNEDAMDLFFRVYERDIVVNKKKLSKEKLQSYAMFVINLAIFGMYPFMKVTVVFKYYDKMYETYSRIIEKSFDYFKTHDLATSLVFGTVFMAFKDVLAKHGAVDDKTADAKAILSLAKRLANLPFSKSISGKILMQAIDAACETEQYDVFNYFRPFLDFVSSNEIKELLARCQETIPQKFQKQTSVVDFVSQLKQKEKRSGKTPAPKSTQRQEPPLDISTTPKRRRSKTDERPTDPKTPKLPGAKGQKRRKLKLTQSTASSSSVEMSIHDTSDDSDGFASGLEKGLEYLEIDK